ncbi:adenylate/guanylate cyclase domain-containing protein [Mycolicibacterium wolinskyi]|uniref:adenylate/guanylate cyclase domain-containing protein n=1 Tax=Mycolicibacterium TaxID=1866885 RepID=UPI000A1541F1|nr:MULTISPECIES: adenylate/guanylate cyclase domain-containing protein [Mycolicibacterium]MCV7287174.1 adenylate/guanylate cyclase domain-containing protein [Mycolicibacterium wolinskyi]MCV7292667.1 adenylate/guanylate cyclase domain-containing protein [Mycolicibacterium goodii]
MDATFAGTPYLGQAIAAEAGETLRSKTFRHWVWGAAGVSVAGGGIVAAFLAFAAPIVLSPVATQRLLVRGGTVLVIFLGVAIPIMLWVRRRRFAASTAWLGEGRPPTAAEQRMTLGAPGEAVRLSGAVWAVSAVVFASLAVTEQLSTSLYIFSVIALGGVSTSAVWYLIVERVMRPVSAQALGGTTPEHHFGPTIERRLMMAWTLATGVPLFGVAMLALGYLVDVGFRAQRTFAAILVLVAVAIVVGLFTILIAVRSVTDRVGALRAALAQVQAGDFTARVAVDDASEIGRLQAGFNTMAAGLAERERIRDTFGTYVDRSVAEHILGARGSLQGQEVDVTLMFVDVRGFTAFAERLHPPEVVATLNRLFETIVPLVHRHGGHVDKYAGDGLMAVFGAPRRQPGHADQALAAALAIATAVRSEFGDMLSVGVGLNSGPVVAGNVGGAGRFEFSVIGDAVNVAARVEQATRKTGDTVLLTAGTLGMLTDTRVCFIQRPGLKLRGRTTPVAIYAPVAVKADREPIRGRPPATPSADCGT